MTSVLAGLNSRMARCTSGLPVTSMIEVEPGIGDEPAEIRRHRDIETAGQLEARAPTD